MKIIFLKKKSGSCCVAKSPLNSLQVFRTSCSGAGTKGDHEQACLVWFFLKGLTRL